MASETKPKPKQLDPGYWYEDEDCNNYRDALVKQLGGLAEDSTYLQKNTTSEGNQEWHVLTTPSVNGQTGVPLHQRKVDYFLDSEKQHDTTEKILSWVLQHYELISVDSINSLVDKARKFLKMEEGDYFVAKNILGELVGKSNQEKLLEDKIVKYKENQKKQGQKRDVFDEIEETLVPEEAQNFRILMSCATGDFGGNLSPGIDESKISPSGRHWVEVEIEITKKEDSNCAVRITAYNGELNDENKNRIKDAVSNRLQAIGLEVKEDIAFRSMDGLQQDSSSCGPIACEVKKLRASGKRVPNEPYPKGAHALRKAQVPAISESVTFSKEPPHKPSKSKWDAKLLTHVKSIYTKIFPGATQKAGKDEALEIEHKGSTVKSLSTGETVVTGKNESETLKKALEAMIESNKANGKPSTTIYVETNPKNKTIEDALIAHGKTLGATVKVKGQALVEEDNLHQNTSQPRPL